MTLAASASADTPRVARRHKVFALASLGAGGVSHRVHVLNVSATGALLDGDFPHPVGTRYDLACSTVMLTCRVRWSSGRRFGVSFPRPLTDAEIDIFCSVV